MRYSIQYLKLIAILLIAPSHVPNASTNHTYKGTKATCVINQQRQVNTLRYTGHTVSGINVETNTINNPHTQVYPNPFSRAVIIKASFKQLSNSIVSVYNTAGDLTEEVPFQPYNNGNTMAIWDAANRPNGTYIIQIKRENLVVCHKIIKQ